MAKKQTAKTKRKRYFSKPLCVADREARTYNDVVYDSKAEAIRAQELDVLLRCGEIERWDRQVPMKLGEDTTWKVDFLVTTGNKTHAEEVKGYDSREFQRIKRLWMKYGSYTMIVKMRRGKGWQNERVGGMYG